MQPVVDQTSCPMQKLLRKAVVAVDSAMPRCLHVYSEQGIETLLPAVQMKLLRLLCVSSSETVTERTMVPRQATDTSRSELPSFTFSMLDTAALESNNTAVLVIRRLKRFQERAPKRLRPAAEGRSLPLRLYVCCAIIPGSSPLKSHRRNAKVMI